MQTFLREDRQQQRRGTKERRGEVERHRLHDDGRLPNESQSFLQRSETQRFATTTLQIRLATGSHRDESADYSQKREGVNAVNDCWSGFGEDKSGDRWPNDNSD